MSKENQSIKTGKHETHLTRTGKGAPILFLHGSGPGATGMSNWSLASEELAKEYDLLIPDLVGYGASSHPRTPPGGIRQWMRLWIDQMCSLLDQLQLDRVHLVGNSLGGAIALNLLMEAPHRFGKVLLMGPAGSPIRLTPELDRIWGFYDDPTPAVMKNHMRWFAHDESFIAQRIDDVVRMRLAAAMQPEVRASYEGLFPAPRQRHLDDLIVPSSALRRISNEVLIVHGRDDSVVPYENSTYLLNHLPYAQLHVIGRCNHWTQIEKAEIFHALLRNFFG